MTRTRPNEANVPAGEDALAGTAEAIPDQRVVREDIDVTVTSHGLRGETVLTPQLLLTPDAAIADGRVVRRWTSGRDGTISLLSFPDRLPRGGRYAMTVSGLDETDPDAGLTQRRLAAAGIDYPAWAERFADVRPGSVGPLTRRVAADIRRGLDAKDPYHLAAAIQAYLHDPEVFTYDPNIEGVCDPGEPVSDCLLDKKVGFCEQYATTMAMLLRLNHVPTRYVLGFLPGRRLDDGTWEVDGKAAHAWVEVFFPRVGWVRFDPTPGNFDNGQQTTELELGAPEPVQPTPGPDETPRFEPQPSPTPEATPDATAEPGSQGTGGGGIADVSLPLLGGAVALVLALAVLVWLRSRRRSAGRDEVDLLWARLTGLAARFGHGPRPTQTAYEYTAGLSQVVPSAKAELQVVADARVQARYSGQRPHGDMLAALRAAWRRARIKLLRLVVRRGR